MDCLDKFKDDWPRDGILQVQVLKDKQNISIDRPKLPPYFATKWNHSLANHTSDDNDKCSIDDVHDTETHTNASAIEKMPENHAFVDTIDEEYLMKRETVVYEKILFHARSQEEQTYLPSMQYFIQCMLCHFHILLCTVEHRLFYNLLFIFQLPICSLFINL